MTKDMTVTNVPVLLANLPSEPGVYRMLDEKGTVLYVGKAANLKKRVASYFRKQVNHSKTQILVSQIADIEVSITRSETEALLLESNLIKALQPKYNVLMRDDKSYPFIHITDHADFPRIEIIRSKKKPVNGQFFGPYPSAAAVRETMNLILKIFKLRNCSDSFYLARSRPCLQYQIKRCSAPCTAYVSKAAYQQAILDTTRFLQGKNHQMMDELSARMQQAVAKLAFEEAAVIRDQMKHLRLVQEQQSMVSARGDADVIVISAQPGFACVQCVHVREGEVLGSHGFFPSVPELTIEDSETIWQQVFEAFISYYYLGMPERIPSMILTDQVVGHHLSLQKMLSEVGGRSCLIKTGCRGSQQLWIDFALNNLNVSIAKFQTSAQTMRLRLGALADFIGTTQPLLRLECFDISHTQGSETVASCVVFDEHGPCKREYRRFNIHGITPGDDYAAMEQAITRRYQRLIKAGRLPDVLIIDGGKGQVHVATRVLNVLGISGVIILGIAKGPGRKAGFERLILADELQEKTLPIDSPALQLVQYIRDEAHRFAINAHRAKRQKTSIESSSLESLPGIGAKRRQALLRYFGGLRELSKAPIDEIGKVRGISRELANRIYGHFHSF